MKPLPLYERVKHHLLDRISAGEFQGGARLPSEHELMAQFGASRMTVHRALREMSADGILRRAQGVGTFVRPEKPRSALLEIFDIAEDIKARGHAHRSRIVILEAMRASTALAVAFGQEGGAELFHSLIVHYEDDLAVQLEERFAMPGFAPHYLAQDFTAQTTNHYLQSIAPPSEIEHVIHAVGPDAQAQELLEIGPAEHCLEVRRRTWTSAGPATCSLLTHPGSRYSLGSRYKPAGLRLQSHA